MKGLTRAAGWFAITGVAAAMLWWSWGTWPNLQVDFGRELYVPWRLAAGEVLYRDIPWFDGPLSAYWNAAVFGAFGVGLRSLVAVNLALVAGLVLLLHALLARTNGRAAATTACLLFVSVFAFSRIDAIGNDNYLTPYSHGVTHGLLLSLLGLQLFAVRARGRLLAAGGSGLALGLVALTKAEVFLAAGLALGLGWALDAALLYRARTTEVATEEGLRTRLAPLGAFACGAALPPLVGFALLASAIPPALAASGTLGTWSSLAGSSVASQHFYRETFGSLALSQNVLSLVLWSLGWATVFGVPTALAVFLGRDAGRGRRAEPHEERSTGGLGATLLAAGATFAAFLATLSLGDLVHASWPDALRPLPLVTLALAALAAARIARGVEPPAERNRSVTWLALLVFGGLLLAKIALRVRLDQYGFALAMPATLCAAAAVVARLPEWVRSRGGNERIMRAAALGVVASFAVSFAPIVAARFAERTEPVGRGADVFLTEPSNAPVRDALAAIDALPPDATLAVLPEGVMLNYLTRRVNPTGVVNFMPPELIVFGEDRIIARFESSPPDFIALTHKDTQEYGVDFFGRGYGRALHAWVVRNYHEIGLFGDPPLEPGSAFGVRLFAHGETAR